MTALIKTALAQLDSTNDAHWTSDGSPRMDIIQTIAGDAAITRKMVTDADATFNRETKDEANGGIKAREPVVQNETDEAQEATAEVEVQESTDQIEEGKEPKYNFESMTTQEIFADEETLMAFQAHAAILVNEWSAERKRLENNIINLSQVSARATSWLQRLRRDKTTGGDPNVAEYLAQQKTVREKRAERAKAFIDQGVDAKLLASQLSGKSTLDSALNQRKPARGSTRPDPRMPVRGQRGH